MNGSNPPTSLLRQDGIASMPANDRRNSVTSSLGRADQMAMTTMERMELPDHQPMSEPSAHGSTTPSSDGVRVTMLVWSSR
jgi:hypothetical protein